MGVFLYQLTTPKNNVYCSHMSTVIITKKVQDLEHRVAMLERRQSRKRRMQGDDILSSYGLGSYQVLASLRGLLRKTRGEDPLRYQRRIRKESERVSG